MNSSKKGKLFEDYVAFIYEQLLLQDNIDVRKDVTLEKDGNKHQIDIYYEFKKADIIHRVAIECKNWEKPVDKKELASFESYINDLRNVVGVVVAKNGFTNGAYEYAKTKELILKTPDDLPNFIQGIGLNLQKVYIPNPDEYAEPFYTLLCTDNKENWTGEYYIEEYKNGIKTIPLFISKKHGMEYLKLRKEKNIAVRPLKRGHINFIVDLSLKGLGGLENLSFSLIVLPFVSEKQPMCIAMAAKDFKNEYLLN